MRKWVTLVPMALSLGCLDPPPYRCERDAQCFLQGYPGTCDRASGTCVYPSADCRGILSIEGYVDGQGNCVPAPNNIVGPSTSSGAEDAQSSTGSATSLAETSGESSSSSGEPGGWSTTTRGGTSSESSEGGSGSSTGGGCPQPIAEMTNYGTVSASSQLNGYPATAANDGDVTTSWFSGGGDAAAAFTWSSEGDHCIERVEVDDNSMHANPKLRVAYGFQQAIVRVLADDAIVFENTVALPASPDGHYAVEVGGVVGSQVVLELGPADTGFFGGFSELRVFGDP